MKEKYMREKKIIIGVMCSLICIMAIAFAAFSTTLNINGTSSIESNWKVVFTNIQELSKTNGVTINNTPTASGTTATFDVSLESPGDAIEYQITVENQGTLDAIIEDINASETGSDAIKFEISNIRIGDILLKQESTTFKIKISYDNSITSQPEKTNNKLTVNIDYAQNVGQEITPSDPEIEGPSFINSILEDNTVKNDSEIDFSKTSEEDGTKGLYYTNTNTEDGKTVYYYRGAVENNYVKFAGYYWRIIRINEDGSIRLIYQGETPNAMGSEATIGDSVFNEEYNDNAYVGYMYGTPGSSTYEETHANINDSTIKTVLDTWYEENLLSYASYIADSGFCGDRSIATLEGSTGLGYGKNETYYQINNRLFNTYQPQYSCPQNQDLYTTRNSTKGNKSLEYPIGLITLDEGMYAGGTVFNSNESYYLYTGDYYWGLTPVGFDGSYAVVGGVNSFGRLFSDYRVNYSRGVRPVINLKSDAGQLIGDGTVSNPYQLAE